MRHDVSSVPYFSDEVLAATAIDLPEIADRIEELIKARAEGTVWIAPKASVSLPDSRYAMSTLAVADHPPYLAVKSLLLNPANPDAGEPLMNSVITLQDSTTGRPVALLDGNWITAERTAALSLVAARRMAPPQSRAIAFIGCGLQAHSHLRAMARSFPLTHVQAMGRGAENIDRLRQRVVDMGLEFQLANTPEEAMRSADIIVSSVTRDPSVPPFIDAKHVPDGAFATLVDLGQPWVPDGLTRFGQLIVDDKEQEAVMKSPMVPLDMVSGDLSDLVLGRVLPERPGPTAFVFRGYALGDFALATLAYERAALHGAQS